MDFMFRGIRSRIESGAVGSSEPGAVGSSEPGALGGGGEEEEPGAKPPAGSVPSFEPEPGDPLFESEPDAPEMASVKPGFILGNVEAASKEVGGFTTSFDWMLGKPPPTAVC